VTPSDHVTIEDLEDLGVTKVILNNAEVHPLRLS